MELTKLTFEQLNDKLEKLYELSEEDEHNFLYNLGEAETYELFNISYKTPNRDEVLENALKISGLGEMEQVFSRGGMDDGSTWQRVIHFKDHDLYLMVSGSYASYTGVDFYDGWDSISQVFPKEVVEIKYVKSLDN